MILAKIYREQAKGGDDHRQCKKNPSGWMTADGVILNPPNPLPAGHSERSRILIQQRRLYSKSATPASYRSGADRRLNRQLAILDDALSCVVPEFAG